MWSLEEAQIMSQMVKQINAFGADTEDEFTVIRENGRTQGIFKTWAVPVIPFLDVGNIEELYRLWPKLQRGNFYDRLAQLADKGQAREKAAAITVLKTLEGWKDLCARYPMRLKRSLERARLYSWLIDQRLTRIFNQEAFPVELSQRITRLVSRLQLAFGLMNPFYNLEAIAGDTKWLGLKEEIQAGGCLDAISLLLPSIFREAVIAEQLNWNGLTWEFLYRQVEKVKTDVLRNRILLNLSRLSNAPPHHILFAANALEWIPRRVGGKKNDVPATKSLLNKIGRDLLSLNSGYSSSAAVLSEMNALIRFLNWMPLIEGEKNFSGLNWTYASVCDTAEVLFRTLSANPGVWKDDFGKVFQAKLKDQLVNLDAASAKGRFLLYLIVKEKRAKEKFFQGTDKSWQKQVLQAAIQDCRPGNIIQEPTRRIYPASLVGDKPTGLALASCLLGKQHVLDGFALSTSQIEDLLRGNQRLWGAINQLERQADVSQKRCVAAEIEQIIMGSSLPRWLRQTISSLPEAGLWTIRASSLHEGSARGIYKTILRCPKSKCLEAVKRCIASYYSQKAMLFRLASGMSDLPWLAVLIQPYCQAEGGVAEYRMEEVAVSVGATASKVTSGDAIEYEWKGRFGQTSPPGTSEVVQILEKLAAVFGQVQIEWARAPEGVLIFQLGQISAGTILGGDKAGPEHHFEMASLADVSRLAVLLEKEEGTFSLRLQFDNTQDDDMEEFQGELFALIAQFGERIAEMELLKPVSSSTHFANICRYFRIKLK